MTVTSTATATPTPTVTNTPTRTPTSTPTSVTTPAWTLSYDAPVSQIVALAVYNGKLYAAGFTGQSDSRVYVYDGVSWTDMNFANRVGVGVDMIEALQVFAGRLYFGM